MPRNSDRDVDEFIDDMGDDFDYPSEDEVYRSRRSSSNHRDQRKLLYLAAAAGFVIILAIVLLAGDNNEEATLELTGIESRLESIDQRLALLGGLEERITGLEKQEERLMEAIKAERQVEQALRRLIEDLNASIGDRGSSSASAAGQDDRKMQGSARYHEVQRGETLYRIARKYGISTDRLYELNEISPGDTIYPGQKLRVE